MSGNPEAAVAFAMSHVGDPYRWGGTGPSSWDCSGLSQASYRAAGVSLPRTAALQYLALPHVPLTALQRGDLVFQRAAGVVHHVVIYLGNGQVVDAPHTGAKVRVESLSGFRDSIAGGRPAAFGSSSTPTTPTIDAAKYVPQPLYDPRYPPGATLPDGSKNGTGSPLGLDPAVTGPVVDAVTGAIGSAVSGVWTAFQPAAIKYGAVAAGVALVGVGLYRTVQGAPATGEA